MDGYERTRAACEARAARGDRPDANQLGKAKSRATNGALFLEPLTGKTKTRSARRYADLVKLLSAGMGGFKRIEDERVKALVRRIALLSVVLETQETKHAKGEAIDLDYYNSTADLADKLMGRLSVVSAAARGRFRRAQMQSPAPKALTDGR
jgi:hypothetical protein